MSNTRVTAGSAVAYLGVWLAALGLLVLALFVIPGWAKVAATAGAVNLFVIGLVLTRRGTSSDRDVDIDDSSLA